MKRIAILMKENYMIKKSHCLRKTIRSLLLCFLVIISLLGLFLRFNMRSLGKPQRIIVFPVYAEEILLELIDKDRIIYVGHEYFENGSIFSPTMPLTRSKPGSVWQNCDVEELIHLHPDLIILDDGVRPLSFSTNIEKEGIQIIYVHQPRSVQDIYENIRILGEAVGESQRADSMIANMNCQLDTIEKTLSQSPQIQVPLKTVYYDHWQNSFSIIAEKSGLLNYYNYETDYAEINSKEIAKWNPDVIFFNPIWIDTDGSIVLISEEYAEEIKNKILLDPLLSKTTAVTSDRVFPLYPHRSQFIIQDITNVLQLIYNYDWPLHMGTILCADE